MRTRVVILAGGKGTRMKLETPKVLTPLKGKPLIQYLLDAVAASGVDPRPTIVIGQGAEMMKEILGPKYEYVLQGEQLGTGHAVRCVQKALENEADAVIVLYGDHPFVSADIIRKLRDLHEKEGCVMSMMTTVVPDFDEWRKPLYDFGRIIRNERGEIQADVEKKDATPEQLNIKELNPSFFCFKASWLWSELPKLDNKNVQHEYYLTDLVRIAIENGERIATLNINPLESIGVNTPEHLELAEQLIEKLRAGTRYEQLQ